MAGKDDLGPIRWLRRQISEKSEKGSLAHRVTRGPGGAEMRGSINKYEDEMLHPLDGANDSQNHLDVEHRNPDGYLKEK